LDLERAGLHVVDIGADDIRWHQVRSHLDPSERDTDTVSQCFDGQGLGCSRHPFQQNVTAYEQGTQYQVDHLVLPDNHFFDFPFQVAENIVHPGFVNCFSWQCVSHKF